jgi:hypothetical protein
VEDEPATRGRGVDLFRERAKAHASPLQIIDGLDQVSQRTPKPIELPDHEGITLTHVGEGLSQSRPFGFRARDAPVLEYASASGPAEGIELQLGFLVLC